MTDAVRIVAKSALAASTALALGGGSQAALGADCDCSYNGCYSEGSDLCMYGHLKTCYYNPADQHYEWLATPQTCTS